MFKVGILRRTQTLTSTCIKMTAPKTCLSSTRFVCDAQNPFEKSQKLGRPMSPHLTIYQPQLTWYMSALHRITGAGIATGFYGVAAWYALSPFNSADLVSMMHSLPSPVVFGLKALVAFPLAYHTMNGIRHLVWDAGFCLTLKQVYTTGYIALAGTAVFGIWWLFQE